LADVDAAVTGESVRGKIIRIIRIITTTTTNILV